MNVRAASGRATSKSAGSRLAAATLALAAAGCAPATMDVPAELAPAERLAVEGRGRLLGPKQLTFGAHEAYDIDRSWTRGSGNRVDLGRVAGGTNKARQTYAFSVRTDASEHGRVECRATAARGTVNLPVVDIDASSRAGLECSLRPSAAEGGAWDLVLRSARDRHMEGYAATADHRFDIRATGSGGKLTPATTRGYEIRRGQRVVAAVETVNAGAVWLAPGLSAAEREVLAGVASALLLFEELPTED